MYKYCIGAMPSDPDFRRKGGKIIIVLVHHGTLKLSDSQWTLQIFRVQYDDENAVKPHLQLPETHTGVLNSDGNMQYGIDFEMSMPMFKDNGRESFIFNAQYKEFFVRPPGTIQRGREQLAGLVFTVVKKGRESVSIHQSIRGLSVLKCHDPSRKFRFRFGQDSYNRTQRLGIFRKAVEVDLSDF